MSSELHTNAAIDGPGAEFHIHQVVAAFHTSKAIKLYRKKWFLLGRKSAKKSKGTKAINIKKVSGDVGHAANNKSPDNNER